MRKRSAANNPPDTQPADTAPAPTGNSTDVAELLVALRPEPKKQIVPKADVVNGLLDLRLAATAPVFIDRIDRALVDVPGRTTTPADWWRDELDLLEVLVGDTVAPPPLANRH